MSRNSIEKRSTLGEKNWVNRSRCNPESATSIPTSPNLPDRYQQFQQSTVSIRKLPSDEGSLENRYQTLHKLYRGLMAKIELQDQNVNDQSKQLTRLQNIHERNEMQIRRLRGMLGFLHKQNKQTQTKPHDYSDLRSPKESLKSRNCGRVQKFSDHSSNDQSKIIFTANTTKFQSQIFIKSPTGHKSVPKSSNNRLSRSSKYLFNEPSCQLDFKKEERCRSPGLKEKYKFIPSLPLA